MPAVPLFFCCRHRFSCLLLILGWLSLLSPVRAEFINNGELSLTVEEGWKSNGKIAAPVILQLKSDDGRTVEVTRHPRPPGRSDAVKAALVRELKQKLTGSGQKLVSENEDRLSGAERVVLQTTFTGGASEVWLLLETEVYYIVTAKTSQPVFEQDAEMRSMLDGLHLLGRTKSVSLELDASVPLREVIRRAPVALGIEALGLVAGLILFIVVAVRPTRADPYRG